MHYIVGTKIIVNTSPNVRQSSGPRSVGSAQVNRRVNTEHFQPGNEYMLHYIKKEKKKFVYTFKNNTTDEKFLLPFESPGEADRYIARLLGEKLPDYKKHYDTKGQ